MSNVTPKSLADDVAAHINSVQALNSAMDTIIHSLMSKALWGPYWPVMQHNGATLQSLLAISDGILHDMSETQGEVVRSFCGEAD